MHSNLWARGRILSPDDDREDPAWIVHDGAEEDPPEAPAPAQYEDGQDALPADVRPPDFLFSRAMRCVFRSRWEVRLEISTAKSEKRSSLDFVGDWTPDWLAANSV